MKRAILIVSFGSSNLYAYKLVEKFINKIREYIKEDVYIKYVFTSKILIKRMKEKKIFITDIAFNGIFMLIFDKFDAELICRDCDGSI